MSLVFITASLAIASRLQISGARVSLLVMVDLRYTKSSISCMYWRLIMKALWFVLFLSTMIFVLQKFKRRPRRSPCKIAQLYCYTEGLRHPQILGCSSLFHQCIPFRQSCPSQLSLCVLYKLNRHGEMIQICLTPLYRLNHSVFLNVVFTMEYHVSILWFSLLIVSFCTSELWVAPNDANFIC